MQEKSLGELVEEAGLGWANLPRDWQSRNLFFLDLNSCSFYVPANPKAVMAVVRLARQVAKSDKSGEHNSLLHVIAAYQTDLRAKNGIVHWRSTAYMDKVSARIHMRDWLKKNGQKPDSIYEYNKPWNRFKTLLRNAFSR